MIFTLGEAQDCNVLEKYHNSTDFGCGLDKKMNAAIIGKIIKMTHVPTPLSLITYRYLPYACIHIHIYPQSSTDNQKEALLSKVN